MIDLGNASAPRWYGCDLAQLDGYVQRILEFGAKSTELVLHDGPSDERIERVHVLRRDWEQVAATFGAHGIPSHLHASLSPLFSLRRWSWERRKLEQRYRPMIRFGAQLAQSSGKPVVLVLHAAGDLERTAEQNAAATADFLTWALAEGDPDALRFAIELRHDRDRHPARFDTDRNLLLRFVGHLDSSRVGICWDIGNDLLQSRDDSGRAIPPSQAFLRAVNHVHVHGRGQDGLLHHPLLSSGNEALNWLGLLPAAGIDAAVTMEIRYRLASQTGDPMKALERSYALASERLAVAETGAGRNRESSLETGKQGSIT